MAPIAHWESLEEKALVDYLFEHRSESGDAGNFKPKTFKAALTSISPFFKRGATKTVKSLQNKWTLLRKTYRTILAIKEVSGWTWDDETGASITPPTASSWDDYVKKHPEAKPFRNKGWPHLDKVSFIIPSGATGANVFFPTTSSVQSPSRGGQEEEPPAATGSEPTDGPGDDQNEDESPPPQDSSSSRHRREPATPTRPVRSRNTGASALARMSDSIESFNQSITMALAPPPTLVVPTPIRRTNAIAFAAKKEKVWLTRTELIRFIDYLRKDQIAADVYMAIEDSDIRKEWVRIQMSESLGIIVFPDLPELGF